MSCHPNTGVVRWIDPMVARVDFQVLGTIICSRFLVTLRVLSAKTITESNRAAFDYCSCQATITYLETLLFIHRAVSQKRSRPSSCVPEIDDNCPELYGSIIAFCLLSSGPLGRRLDDSSKIVEPCRPPALPAKHNDWQHDWTIADSSFSLGLSGRNLTFIRAWLFELINDRGKAAWVEVLATSLQCIA